ncbi:DUF2934 domain-containing protein [Caballeronia grimmiae]|uniref:DUF2934 domain-containing protein n=1 Tax=Caballeronia grimmiae TaxID=1071679 RepID=UPI0038BC502E
MAPTLSDDDIRSRAYELWVEAGRPDGRSEDFWEQARLQLVEREAPTEDDVLADSDDFADAPLAKQEPGGQ